ncbi:hypothetical protein [Vibrio harveyi]|uniref:hypothetical protein n=1 Tax=Vibrio harveyi TaxID=669 RepID=UPI00374CDF80
MSDFSLADWPTSGVKPAGGVDVLYLYGLDGELLARLWGLFMEINSWFDFIIYTIYFFGVVVIILPVGAIFLWLTLKNLIKMRLPKYERKHYKYFFARNVLEVCIAGGVPLFFLFGICFLLKAEIYFSIQWK